jgi:adenine-specific DNA-methyltransferase
MKLQNVLDRNTWKSHGAVSTPDEVVNFMLAVPGVQDWHNLDILEPACGFCNFLTAIAARYPENRFVGVEFNPEVFAMARALHPTFNLILADFLLWETADRYDLVIGNPPYGIVGSESHYPIHVLQEKKPLYKQRFATWSGKYNVYGAFVEKGLSLLRPHGRLVYIIPATFMILDEFAELRHYLARSGRVKVYYLGPGIFDGVSVSSAILVVERGRTGSELYEVDGLEYVRQCYAWESYRGELIRFETAETAAFEQCGVPLGEIFDIRISARSPEVRRNPYVQTKFFDGAVPLLNGRNLQPGSIDYGACHSGFWMRLEDAPRLKSFYSRLRIAVGHTKGGRVVAALDERRFPWIGDVYHLMPKGDLSTEELRAVVHALNADETQQYVRALYKEITPHITATQLLLLPLHKGIGSNAMQSQQARLPGL